MNWNNVSFDYWCENYYNLRGYELNPFEVRKGVFKGEEFIQGLTLSEPPMEELFDANWQFDRAIKSLDRLEEEVFRMRYLDGYSLKEIMREYPCKDIEGIYDSVKGKVMDYLRRIE